MTNIEAKYRNPLTGESWSGRGKKPKWLEVALEDGASLDDFLVGEQDAATDDRGDPDQIADPSTAIHEDPEYGTNEHAELFMLGDLLDACTKHFKPLAVPWSDLDEREQTRLLERLHEDLQTTVKKAVKIIAANARVTFRAEVEAVQFKGPSDVKATLKMVNTAESDSLADSAGGFVTVVIEQLDDLLAIPESALKGEPDQKPLFDASVQDTSADVDPEDDREAA